MARALCINMGSIRVGHVGQAQPEGRNTHAHTDGALSPAAKHDKGVEKEERVVQMQ